MSEVLHGVRIVEQGTFITGPCAGMMLADLGADIIKLESPGQGDPYRNFKGGHYSPHFQAYNRNKRSLTLDLKSDSEKAVFYDLIAQADVYIQNFRPGAARRIGADYETLAKINPRLIYCSISGYGPDGPYSARPVYDSVAQAASGFLSVAIDTNQPRFLGPALADSITGIYAALGIAAALAGRAVSGQGKYLEISMLEAMTHFAIEPFMAYFALGEAPKATDRPKLAQAFIVRCLDGKLLAFHLSSLDKFWEALAEAADDAALKNDPRFAVRPLRIANYEALGEALNKVFQKRTRAAWLTRLADFDLPFSAINTIEDAVNDPQVAHLGLVVPVEHGREGASRAVRPAFTFDGKRAQSVFAAPQIGEQDADIRAALIHNNKAWPADPRRAQS